MYLCVCGAWNTNSWRYTHVRHVYLRAVASREEPRTPVVYAAATGHSSWLINGRFTPHHADLPTDRFLSMISTYTHNTVTARSNVSPGHQPNCHITTHLSDTHLFLQFYSIITTMAWPSRICNTTTFLGIGVSVSVTSFMPAVPIDACGKYLVTFKSWRA